MGSAVRSFRLVRFDGPGCAHHVLLRAGRPAYPNPDQGAEDAADDLLEVTLRGLTQWAGRWWVRWECRGTGHEPQPVAETDGYGLVELRGAGVDLEDDVGMCTLDVWVTTHGAAMALGVPGDPAVGAADAGAFAAAAAEQVEPARDWPPPRLLRVLLLTDRSGDGDLRDT